MILHLSHVERKEHYVPAFQLRIDESPVVALYFVWSLVIERIDSAVGAVESTEDSDDQAASRLVSQ